MKTLTREKKTIRVSFVSIGGNLFLCVLKLFAGILGHSGALISDAVHSAADAVDTIIVIIGIKLASKAPDARHPYGHERMECVAAILLSIVLGIVGAGIGCAGLEKILSGQYASVGTPSRLALFAALISIAVKEGLYWYMRGTAKKISSDSLMAIAWHNRADSLSSIGSLVGIVGARAGFPILDPLVSVIICIFVIKAALSIFRGAINKMVDHACDPQTADAIQKTILSSRENLRIGQFRTRLFGDKIYVDLELFLPGETSLAESYAICRQVQSDIEKTFEKVKECRIVPAPSQQ
ncbi:cation diffusion facilitator family transporter [bacterium 210820-DFI.6.37]|nr:cation diffusion facilitator family transporter [bacterium 210820-DFI.6.37]